MTNNDKIVEESTDNKDVVVGGGGIGDDDIIEWSKMAQNLLLTQDHQCYITSSSVSQVYCKNISV